MPVTISDEILERAGLSEKEALIEIACRLYDSQIIVMPDATRMTGLSRVEFEGELLKRGLPLIRYTEEDFAIDLAYLQRSEQGSS